MSVKMCLSRIRSLLRAERGQAMTETALLTFFMLVGSGYLLLQFLPDVLAALTVYVHGFYLVLSYPIG